ncbi:MAG: paraquat-inducible protein A [Epsilonproteobacteria bacterium]|nr:paraquat-inducible protein A [Campylobacterota bacterium]
MLTKDKFIRCPICEAVNIDKGGEIYCRRCKEKIYREKRVSYHRTLAFLITAIIFYIPANFYPILITKKLGVSHENTILGGIMVLWEAGSYPVALIILLASVFVPILKFLFITYLLISTKYNVKSSKVDKHKLFYITEAIGSWSMIDVFVVAILSVLIHFSSVQIMPGTGATAFAVMVFFTMLSALSFDTRLIKT